MNKTFSPSEIESKWYASWEESNYFAPSGQGNPYSIMIPPPNVTGTLHMGHGFQQTIMDCLIRFHRMTGHNTLWQVGTDHAGIATQMVVERQLEADSKSRHDLGRDKFIEKVWQWKEHSGGEITQQLRRMGTSLDWSRERFTMDTQMSNAVTEVFIKLHNEGLIYRGKRLVNWDPVLKTAVSDLEVVQTEESGHLWHFRYPLSDNSGHLVVATTRPETMLGDTAVAVHPDDERYQSLIGKTVDLPLCNRSIPIIADDYVDPEFGTGCVKITPAHDFNDYEMGKRHQLEVINILTEDAKINTQAPANYAGLDRYDARAQIISDLENLSLVEKIEPHTLKIPRGDRSGAVIEPFLTNQWYVDAKTLAKPAIAAVENGDIQFVPKQWENTYFAWMRDIQDWCISRQLWWGHRIPAWYDENGNVYVGKDQDDIRTKYSLDNSIALHQDDDVLDTWFSSALWTFATLGWPEKTDDLATFHPTNVLVTGFDIIFFWVARMIMMSLHFTGEIPFKKVYVHGLVRDSEGQKMSKSKGNVLDPIDLIDGISLEELVSKRTSGMMQPKMAKRIKKATQKEFTDGIAAYGTDALRFTFCSLASTGRDIKFDMGRIEGYRNFCNKLWNASRFVLMQVEQAPKAVEFEHAGIINQWIISKLQETTTTVRDAVDKFRFDLASQAIYDLVWNEYCDWYLEFSKPLLFDENTTAEEKNAVQHTLIYVLEEILRLSHPFIPFISEEIWQQVAPLSEKEGASIMTASYPVAQQENSSELACQSVQWLKSVVTAIRNIRGEMNIPPSKEITVLLRGGVSNDKTLSDSFKTYLYKLAKVETLQWINEEPPLAATALVDKLEINIPLAGLIDTNAEISRLEKEYEKIRTATAKLSQKLENPGFTTKAPANVVEQERNKLADMQEKLEKLEKLCNKFKAHT